MIIDNDLIYKARHCAGNNWIQPLDHGGVAYTSAADFCRNFIFEICDHLEKSMQLPIKDVQSHICGTCGGSTSYALRGKGLCYCNTEVKE